MKGTKGIKGTITSKPATVTKLNFASETAARNRNTPKNYSTTTDVHPEDLKKLKARISQLPEIDAAKIVELHDRIIKGEYKINSQSLADKLQKFESDL